jgi:hypothetical protein
LFLALYYAVLIPIQRNGRPLRNDNPPMQSHGLDNSFSSLPGQLTAITVPESLLYVWIAGFAYEESKDVPRLRYSMLTKELANSSTPGRHFMPLISGVFGILG